MKRILMVTFAPAGAYFATGPAQPGLQVLPGSGLPIGFI